MQKEGVIAVITGDLVNSSEFSGTRLQALLDRISTEFDRIQQKNDRNATVFTMFRGDSFQGIVEEPKHALKLALQLKSFINSFTDSSTDSGNTAPIADVRISIGVGMAVYDTDAINVSNGAAFQLSGRTLDSMKKEHKGIALTTSNNDVNDEFAVHLRFLDRLTSRWSVASAEVVYFLLKDLKQQEIAEKLNRSQADINHRKKAAGWDDIQLLLERYERVINKEFV